MSGADMSSEQAADLAALERMAAEAEPMPADAGGEPAPSADPAESWAMVPAMIGSALGMALPELREVYSEQACRAWGAAMVPVADKYGWDADTIMGPEVGLLCASLPLAVGTIAAVQKAKAEKRPAPRQVEAPKPSPEVPPEVGAAAVTIGAPR